MRHDFGEARKPFQPLQVAPAAWPPSLASISPCKHTTSGPLTHQCTRFWKRRPRRRRKQSRNCRRISSSSSSSSCALWQRQWLGRQPSSLPTALPVLEPLAASARHHQIATQARSCVGKQAATPRLPPLAVWTAARQCWMQRCHPGMQQRCAWRWCKACLPPTQPGLATHHPPRHDTTTTRFHLRQHGCGRCQQA